MRVDLPDHLESYVIQRPKERQSGDDKEPIADALYNNVTITVKK